MSFSLVLFDLDDTLFDFSRSERQAFAAVLTHHGICGDFETIYRRYKEISSVLWKKFENQEISKNELRVNRFQMLIESHGYDSDPHSMSEYYLEVLKGQAFLVEGALEVCERLVTVVRLAVVTNGIAEVQKNRLRISLLAPYIEFMVVSEECGFAKPHRGIFDCVLKRAVEANPDQVLMVGDRLDVDILGAHTMGMKSCWFNPTGHINEIPIVPDFEISRLVEILTPPFGFT